MSWVHCNNCFTEPADKINSYTFYLTACSHMCCQRCYEQSKPNCPACKRQTNVIRIDSSLTKQYRQLFMDPQAVIEMKMTELEKVRKFQEDQIRCLVNGSLKFQAALTKCQERINCYEKQVNCMKKENQALLSAFQKRSTCSAPQQNESPIMMSEINMQQQRHVPHSTLREDLAPVPCKQQQAPSTFRGDFTPSFTSDPFKSSSSILRGPMSIARIDGNNVPKAELRATFDARSAQQQRTRSKSPNTIGMMQGTIKKGSILSINNRLS